MSQIEKILRNRILQHIVFWSIALFFLLRHFQASSELAPTDYIYTGVFAIFIIIAVYINLLWLIPRFFQQSNYFIYFLYLGLVLVLFGYLQILLFDHIVEWVFPGFFLISYFDYWQTLQYFLVFIGLSSLLHFSKSWFAYKETQAALTEIRKEKVEAELQALKSQINPHFLFNSLNSIYALVLKKSDLAPKALIKLSDAMRYIISESDKERVLLKHELDFISNYIELQSMRMSDKDRLDVIVNGEAKGISIAPLLLIPLIENCFKYGPKGEVDDSFVQIEIEFDQHFLQMKTRNNIGMVDEVEKNKAKGTGLSNLRKRLDLIYPQRHSLTVVTNEKVFEVDLNIDL